MPVVFGIVFALGFVALLGYAVFKRRGNPGGAPHDGTQPYLPPHDPTRGTGDLPG